MNIRHPDTDRHELCAIGYGTVIGISVAGTTNYYMKTDYGVDGNIGMVDIETGHIVFLPRHMKACRIFEDAEITVDPGHTRGY